MGTYITTVYKLIRILKRRDKDYSKICVYNLRINSALVLKENLPELVNTVFPGQTEKY